MRNPESRSLVSFQGRGGGNEETHERHITWHACIVMMTPKYRDISRLAEHGRLRQSEAEGRIRIVSEEQLSRMARANENMR